MHFVDFIKRYRDGKALCDTSRETHRGLIRIKFLWDDEGNCEGVKLFLTQKPTRTDPAVERGFEKGFVIDRDKNSISSEESMWQILKHVFETGREEDTPLFRNLESGAEVTYA